MKHGSLFSGIGGFDLAAQWMGWENIFHCEWNQFGRRVLSHYWPESISYEDITKTDFSTHSGQIDILTGGFPCQPYSTAGKRLGKEDDRHLWPEMLRAIREISPRYVVGENVRGLTNWNGGLVFDEVQADLESEGYEVIPFLLPACAVNAPHRRDRIWFIATHANNIRSSKQKKSKEQSRGAKTGSASTNNGEQSANAPNTTSDQNNGRRQGGLYTKLAGVDAEGLVANADSNGHELRGLGEDRCKAGKGAGIEEKQQWLRRDIRGVSQQTGQWERFPTQSPICSGDDGLPAELDGIAVSRHRKESLKAYGNAIVPQVALQIFKAISDVDGK